LGAVFVSNVAFEELPNPTASLGEHPAPADRGSAAHRLLTLQLPASPAISSPSGAAGRQQGCQHTSEWNRKLMDTRLERASLPEVSNGTGRQLAACCCGS